MKCCICDRDLEPGDIVLRLTQHRVFVNRSGRSVLQHMQMEDGATDKLTCPTCPIVNGAPMALIGADRESRGNGW